jgi:hypothetical protein
MENKHNTNINKLNNKEKMYTYCQKCLNDFDEPSSNPFCDFECCQAYYRELREDADDVFREMWNID